MATRLPLLALLSIPSLVAAGCGSSGGGGDTDGTETAAATDSDDEGDDDEGDDDEDESSTNDETSTSSTTTSTTNDSTTEPEDDDQGSSEGGEESTGSEPEIPEFSPGCGVPFSDEWLTDWTVSWGEVSQSAFDGDRQFMIELPENYDPDTAYPIVFTFHGYGSEAENAYGERVARLWDYQAITIYPNSAGVGWNKNPGGEDFAHFVGILNVVGQHMCIDMNRVFTRGTSDGGMMSNALGCARSDLVDGMGVTAAQFTLSPDECGGPMPAWVMHGRADQTVPFSAGENIRDIWIGINGCSQDTTPIPDTPCVEYDCSEAPLVWCAHDGGHDIPATQGLAETLNAFLRSL